MIASIVKSIDLAALDREINLYLANYEKINYLIMSTATAKAIANIYKDSYVPDTNFGHTYDTYCGFPIAICDALAYGDVDIR